MANRMRELVTEVLNFLRKNICDNFRENIGNANYLAMSFGMGTFFALIPIPMQTTLCIFAWAIMRKWRKFNFNVAIASVLTLVSNPLTDVFFFYGYYIFGVFVLGIEAYSFEGFTEKFESLYRQHGGFWHIFDSGADFVLKDIGYPIAVGSIILSIVLAVGCYLGVYAGVKIFAKKKRTVKFKSAQSAKLS